MLDLLKQYFKIIGYTLTGIAFGFSFFYILLNANHYSEIRRNFAFNSNEDKTVITIKQNLEQIKNNINTPVASEYINGVNINDINKLKNRFNICINSIDSNSFKEIMLKNTIDIRDVYKFRELYENEVASGCLVNQFIQIISENSELSKLFIDDDKDLLKIIFNELINNTEYVKKDLLNNSSYYFSTEISLLTGKNLTRDSFYQILSSYEKSTSLLLELSKKYKNIVTITNEVINYD